MRFNDPEASAAASTGRCGGLHASAPSPVCSSAVSGGERRPPRQSDADQPLYERAAGIARRLNLRIGAVHRWSSADVGFRAGGRGPPSTGSAPSGSGERTADEYVLRSSLIDRAVLLANLMLECGGNEVRINRVEGRFRADADEKSAENPARHGRDCPSRGHPCGRGDA